MIVARDFIKTTLGDSFTRTWWRRPGGCYEEIPNLQRSVFWAGGVVT